MYERKVKTKQEILREKEERKKAKQQAAIRRKKERQQESVQKWNDSLKEKRSKKSGIAKRTAVRKQSRSPKQSERKDSRSSEAGIPGRGCSDSPCVSDSRRSGNRSRTAPTYGQLVQRARDAARKRDNYTCQSTGRTKRQGYLIDGAHLLPVRYAGGTYDPTNPDHVVSLCRVLHTEYDRNKTIESRAEWLRRHGLSQWADKLIEIAYKQ